MLSDLPPSAQRDAWILMVTGVLGAVFLVAMLALLVLVPPRDGVSLQVKVSLGAMGVLVASSAVILVRLVRRARRHPEQFPSPQLNPRAQRFAVISGLLGSLSVGAGYVVARVAGVAQGPALIVTLVMAIAWLVIHFVVLERLDPRFRAFRGPVGPS